MHRKAYPSKDPQRGKIEHLPDKDPREEKEVITVQKINTIHVKPLKSMKPKFDRPAKGHEMFPNPYANIFILSRKNSGKSVLVSNIIQKVTRANYTTIVVFSNTLLKDPCWISLKKWCKKHNRDFIGHTSIQYTDPKGKKHDALAELLKLNRQIGDEEALDSSDSEVENEENSGSSSDDYQSEEEPYVHSGEIQKYPHLKPVADQPSHKVEYPTIAPKLFIVFDDISTELKLASVQELTKQNRHFEATVCASSQTVTDLYPSCRKQADYLCIFGGLKEQDLKRLLDDASLGVSLETLMKMYRKSTEKKYNFLYIDVRNDQYRMNFDRKFNISTQVNEEKSPRDANSENE